MQDLQQVPDQTSLFFRAAISVDTVIFGYEKGKLMVLLIKRNREPELGKWALPGDLLGIDEEAEALRDTLIWRCTHLHKPYVKQIRAFTQTDRHPKGRVINVSYYVAVRIPETQYEGLDFASEYKWWPVDALPEELAFDHAKQIQSGHSRLRKRMRRHPVAFELLPDKFTQPELHLLYEHIFGTKIDKRNFYRKVMASNLIEELDEFRPRPNNQGRAARLFRFDREAYRADHRKVIRFDF